MAKRRVVVTGLGTVNPVGNSVKEYWDGLMNGRSGIGPITKFDVSEFPSKIGGQLNDWAGPQDPVDPREAKRMDPFTQYAVGASLEALQDAGVDPSPEDRDRCGVVVGTGIGGLLELQQQHVRMLEKGVRRISPFTVPKMMGNAAAGTISILAGFRGPSFSVQTACASAANSIGDALRLVQNDEADLVIGGGAEAALTEIGLGSFCALKGLSTRNDDPEHASRPWDKDRDGFLLSEGAGVIILESLERAKARGAKIYGEITGFGMSCDAHHITAPEPDGAGAKLAMLHSVKDAGINPEDVDYINAHGTSTVLGDVGEVRAIKAAFGDHARNGLLVSSTKSATGHLLGASGGVEVIACLKALETGVLPATLNLENPDDECDLDFIPNTPREKQVDYALSNSFGFGGHNACVIMKRFTG
ncbi:MAG: beta-ketoacyl-ACP synthase II [Phycisphaerae bacterium]